MLLAALVGVTFALGFQSCRKDKTPLSNLTGISSFSIQGFEDYTFTIDQHALTITNVDSLPYQTDPNLIAIFNVIEGSNILVNGAPQQSGVTRNNFAHDVTYVTTAEDGVTTRSYNVKVNISQIDPHSVAWKRVTENGGWGPYVTSNVGYFNNRFWAFGAESGAFQTLVSATYQSNDAVTWTKATTNIQPMPFGSRQSAVFGFQNKIWLLGGLLPPLQLPDGGTTFVAVTNQVWSSADGTTWAATERIDNPAKGTHWSVRERIPVVAFQNKMWIIGGNAYPPFGNTNTPGVPLNDVWSSSDGITWTEVLSNFSADHGTPNGFFVARTHPAVFVHNDKIYVAGGRNSSGTLLNDVWTSTNGSTWTELNVTAHFDPVWGHQVVSYNGQLFMLGGYIKNAVDQDAISSDLWISEDDGVTWAKADASDPRKLPGNFPGRAFFNMFVHDNAIWIVGGEHIADPSAPNTRVYFNDTWKGALVK